MALLSQTRLDKTWTNQPVSIGKGEEGDNRHLSDILCHFLKIKFIFMGRRN